MSVGERPQSTSWKSNGRAIPGTARTAFYIERISRDRRNWIRTLSRFAEFRFVTDPKMAIGELPETCGLTASFQDPVYISGL
jgi:hypothetical protein